MVIRFETINITPVKRIAMGVRSIKLNEDDEVLIGLPIKHNTDMLATFSESGIARKTPLNNFPTQGRGGKGVKVGNGEPLAGAALIDDSDNLLIVGKPNSICIKALDVPQLSRTAAGNTMIKIIDANKIEIKTYEHGSNDTRMPVHRRAGREEGIHLHQWETLAMELLLVERKGRKKASPPHVP